MAFLSSHSYRKSITIQQANLTGDLTNHVVYVPLAADADLAEALATGYDIRFTSSDGETLLYYERVSWSGGGGSAATAEFHVKVPSVASTGDATVIYLYYGDADASDGSDAANTWSGYVAVYHCQEASWSGAAGEVKDARNTHNGVRVGNATTTASGKLGRAGTFDGSGDWFYTGANSALKGANVTWEAWVKDAGASGAYKGIAGNIQYQAGAFAGCGIVKRNDDKYAFLFDTSAGIKICSGNAANTDANWHHIVGTHNGTTGILYVDGVAQMDTDTGAIVNPADAATYLHGGIYYNDVANYYWNGQIDEVRFSTTARSAASIKFTYHNHTEADNELTWGAEETPPATDPEVGLIGGKLIRGGLLRRGLI